MFCVDFIWYGVVRSNFKKNDGHWLNVCNIWQPPPAKLHRWVSCLPNKFWPSDHLSLCCDFTNLYNKKPKPNPPADSNK
jgi:hypothetical protein